MAFTAEDARVEIANTGEAIQYCVMSLVFQTFFFGIYTLLTGFSTRMLLARKLRTNTNKMIFGLTTFMYLLSAAHWAYNVADALDFMSEFTKYAQHPDGLLPDHTTVSEWSPLWNAVVLINYVLSDAVVVWRAWVICGRGHRKYLWITIGFLFITGITVFLTIVLRIIGTVQSPFKNLPSASVLERRIDILQVTTLITSLLSNLTATGVVGATTLYHWRSFREAFSDEKKQTSTNRILLLVVESGVIYCFFAILTLSFSVIRLPHGTLGDLYTPIQVQIAGVYPCAVLLLVSSQRSLNDSVFVEDDSVLPPGPPKSESDTGSIRFAHHTNPPLTGSQFTIPLSTFSDVQTRLSDVSEA
ncbi:hypothetical protein FB45DRAFT_780274 [Roridomyces roridus]|uniref:Uncharacterized protein n=1 Tax=Roridomyces roridus TaxID=1738132 RepID=A0AAD7FZC7_9AGAR|nr:hypothetical protein FB45DRAFT_780274 [Roridomyces roridus]